MSARKSVMISRQIIWCGRLWSAQGYEHLPSRVEAIVNMLEPTDGAQLYQMLAAANWMRNSVPDFSSIVEPMRQSLELVIASTPKGRRTKKPCANVRLTPAVGWTPDAQESFKALKEALKHHVLLSYPDPDHELLVVTDASKEAWGGVITQVPASQWQQLLEHEKRAMDKGLAGSCHLGPRITKVAELDHQAIAFVSGRFRGPELRWGTIDKEAYALKTVLLKFEHIMWRQRGVTLLTDHRNLEFLFGQEHKKELPAVVRDKLHRWYLRLQGIPYRVRYLKGENNDWPDLLSRWGAPPADESKPRVLGEEDGFERCCALMHQLPHPEETDVVMPDINDIQQVQQKYLADLPDKVIIDEQGILRWQGIDPETPAGQCPIWIPEEASDIRLRILVVAHAREGIHAARDTTLAIIRKRYWWKGISSDVRTFVNECLHCLRGKNTTRTPRPLGETLIAEYPNEILHMDVLSIGESTSGMKYILVLKDGFSKMCMLYVCKQADSRTAADALRQWCTVYGPPQWLISDGGSHFKNRTIRKLTKDYMIRHEIKLAHCPWTNGSVENMCGHVIRLLRTLRSARRGERNADWTRWVPAVVQRLNDTPYRNHPFTPRQLFTNEHTGKPPQSDFLNEEPWVIKDFDGHTVENPVYSHDVDKAWTEFRNAYAGMHQRYTSHQDRLREQRHRDPNRHKGHPALFSKGDFVLEGRLAHRTGEKISVRWKGPHRITAVISDYIFEVEDLVTRGHHRAHAQRLKKYCEASRGKLEELRVLAKEQFDEWPVDRIEQFIFNPETDQWDVEIKWTLDEEDDEDAVSVTMEPLGPILADVPKKVLDAYKRLKGNQTPELTAELHRLAPGLLGNAPTKGRSTRSKPLSRTMEEEQDTTDTLSNLVITPRLPQRQEIETMTGPVTVLIPIPEDERLAILPTPPEGTDSEKDLSEPDESDSNV
eukprot:GHVU01061971.1.p1 GENE.GHVU01061971.1~~GHVU01061971.1.p1  ORF type:complete len:951 (+),score=76.55 GHVU01061971.1:34-2853(+)